MKIGIDIGATRVKAALIDSSKIVSKKTVYLRPEDKNPDGIILFLERLIKELSNGMGEIRGVGIGVAGVIDHEAGMITQSPNFPSWRDFYLRRELEKRLNLPVVIDNDANMVAWGEFNHGAGQGYASMILLTLGSGVGGGIVLDRKLYRGLEGMAGEIGHITVEPEGFRCNCGNNGCLEQYASAVGLRNFVKRDNLFGEKTHEYLKDPDLPKKLYDMAKNGNERAIYYFKNFGYYLAIALGGLLNTLNIKLIVFSGGLANSMDLWKDELLNQLGRRTFRAVLQGVEIKKGILGDLAGVWGAAALIQD